MGTRAEPLAGSGGGTSLCSGSAPRAAARACEGGCRRRGRRRRRRRPAKQRSLRAGGEHCRGAAGETTDEAFEGPTPRAGASPPKTITATGTASPRIVSPTAPRRCLIARSRAAPRRGRRRPRTAQAAAAAAASAAKAAKGGGRWRAGGRRSSWGSRASGAPRKYVAAARPG